MRPGRTSSPRNRAALALLGLLLFPRPAVAQNSTLVLPNVEPKAPSYTRAYVALGAGAVLTVTSFGLAASADQAYERYLHASDPGSITAAYDDAHQLDQWSAALLLAGTASLALGVYWRFIHRPAEAHGAALELEPVLTPQHAGLALAVRFP
jgi:hypothetical protein